MSNADPYRQGAPPQFPRPAGQGAQPTWPPPPGAPAYPQPVQPYVVAPAPAMPPFPSAAPYAAPHPAYPAVPAYPQQPVSFQVQPLAAMPEPLPLSAQPAPVPLPARPKPVPLPVSAAPVPTPATKPAAATTNRPLPANRPIPASARPIPIDKSKQAAGPKIDEAAAEEASADPTHNAAKKAPPWLVSLVVHMVLVIILALLTLPPLLNNQIEIEAIPAEELGEQLLDNTLQSPESLDMQVDTPALSFDIKPADDPLAAPPILPDFTLDATTSTDTIQAPSIGLALTGREAGAKKALLAAYGGNATTEAAVVAGLEWLKRQQMKDGGWSLTGPYQDGAGIENRLSATAMALLAFQGYGATHKPKSSQPDFSDVVRKGWDYLLKTQNPDGYFSHDAAPHHKLYAQAQATIAICEIYGMTKDEKFKRPAQLALDYAIKAQAPEGGWRYEPKIDSDTSVTGWYVMALQSGMMAGLEVPSPNLDLISKFLDSVGKEDGSQYAYQPGRESTIVMTAEGLLCRQYLGWKHDDPRMRNGINMLLANRINYGDQNVYYWYYATQACHHMDGDDWSQWNTVMRQAVPTAQTKTGNEKGSWGPSGDRWNSHGGRLYVTCLSIYMLEVYYRHLPIYKWRLQ